MKKHNAFKQQDFFSVLETCDESQIATMILQPGQWSGKKENEHPASEQTLLVVVVPRGIAYRFGNTSDKVARTFNVYAPPAY